METTQEDGSSEATFLRRERKITQQESEMGLVVHQSSNGLHRGRCSKIHKRLRRNQSNPKSKLQKNGLGECDEEKVGIEGRIKALQRIVPGGESLEVDTLFEETALYILALQGQVKAMKVLTSFFEGLEKENAKFGG